MATHSLPTLRLSLTFLILVVFIRPAPGLAQDDQRFPDEPPPWGDLVADEDTSLRDDDPQFGVPLEAYTGSELFLDPDAESGVVDVPPPGESDQRTPPVVIPAPAPWAALNCADYTQSHGTLQAKFQPLRLAASNARYFSFKGQPLILVGASADAGCLLSLPSNNSNQCSIGNYVTVFEKSENRPNPTVAPTIPLNKIRIWIGMGLGYPSPNTQANAPFLWVASPSAYWLLDSMGGQVSSLAAYFDRLRSVVNEARRHKMFVEVTLFSPFEGSTFDLGPWSRINSRASDPPGSANIVPMGFSSEYYQVLNDTSSPDQVTNEKMRRYQANLIKWTVDTLWCFDNITWEVGNEPEGLGRAAPQRAVNPVPVTKWQKSMICEVRKAEKAYSYGLAYGHVVAVQPFTTDGTAALLAASSPPPGCQDDANFPLAVQVLNGHYTRVSASVAEFPSGSHVLNAGAIDLIRNSSYNNRAMPFGFNETAITNLAGERGTKSHINGVSTPGRPEAARAEAWEFLLSGGTAYDHFGYLGSFDAAVRQQLGRLLKFFGTDRFGLQPPPGLTNFAPASMGSWFTVGGYGAWDSRTHSQRYWAALATSTPVRALLLYLHHSTPRCKPDTTDYEQGCAFPASGIPFGSYDARIWTTAPLNPQGAPLPPAGYQETFTFSSGTYKVTWIDPETTLPLPEGQERTITCSSSCQITSPIYKFDILWRVVRQ